MGYFFKISYKTIINKVQFKILFLLRYNGKIKF